MLRKEIRGEFNPIATKLPGVQICELLPKTAALMDKVSIIRSLVGLRDEHTSFQNLTGYPMNVSQREGWPNMELGHRAAERRHERRRSRRLSICFPRCSTSRTTVRAQGCWDTVSPESKPMAKTSRA